MNNPIRIIAYSVERIAYRLKPSRKLLFFFLFLFLLSTIHYPLSAVFAQEAKEPIICDGDRVEYLDQEKKVIGTGNVVIRYEDTKLTAEQVTIDMEKRVAQASGNVALYQDGSVFKAQRITYDFDTKKGTLIKGEVKTGPYYGRCESIEKVARGEFHLEKGYVTTCDGERPHYRLAARRIKLYLDDRIEAQNVTFYAGSIPVFFIPYYVHPISQKTPSVTLVPGSNKDWGPYLLSAWKYYFSRNNQGRLHLDTRQKKGFASGFTHNYILKGDGSQDEGLGQGIFRLYYMQERDRTRPEGYHAERQRYRIGARHRWEMDEQTLGLLEYHRLSDRDFTKDYFYREEYEEEPQPASYISLVRLNPGFTLSLLAQKRANRFFTETEHLPEAKLDIKNKKLMNTSLYYKGQVSAASLTNKNANSHVDDDCLRLDSYNELSYAASPFRIVNINPYVGTRQTWYSKDKYGDEDKIRGILYTGLDMSTKLHRFFDVETKIFGLNRRGLRHVITPTLGYQYIHEPTLSAANLMGFDDADDISRTNKATFSIEQDLQIGGGQGKGEARLRSLGETERLGLPSEALAQEGSGGQAGRRMGEGSARFMPQDLASLLITTDYNFRQEQGSEFSNIVADLEINPSDRLALESDLSYNPHSEKLELANLDFVLKESQDKWRFGLGHRYQNGENNELVMDTSFPVLPGLKARCYERYQFRARELKEQEYTISVDLHCWLAELNYNIKDGDTFWIVMRLKAFPDVPFKLGTSYRRPKPGPVEE